LCVKSLSCLWRDSNPRLRVYIIICVYTFKVNILYLCVQRMRLRTLPMRTTMYVWYTCYQSYHIQC
jgi:hypothetical protein